jgi:hypothetical protein
MDESNGHRGVREAETQPIIQASLARALRIATAQRLFTVVSQGFATDFRRMVGSRPIGQLLQIPPEAGSAPDVILPMSQIMERNPLAIVVFLHARAIAGSERHFHAHLAAAVRTARTSARVVVLHETLCARRGPTVRAYVARVDFLWQMVERLLPSGARRFRTVRQIHRAIRSGWAPEEHERLALEEALKGARDGDFERDVLNRSGRAVVPLLLDSAGAGL